MSLDQQDDFLNSIDPEHFGPGQKPPMAAGRWNREKRRVRRARERWIHEIRSLRRLCTCETCRRHKRPPFPRYYVVNGISYECWLEMQQIDPEMDELLAPLRNNRERAGSALIGRRPGGVEYSSTSNRGTAHR
jgi:hypothetical protein